MTKLQVYRTDQMNVGPVDPEVFPRMANQRDFYLKSDVDALLATLQQPEPTAECPYLKDNGEHHFVEREPVVSCTFCGAVNRT